MMLQLTTASSSIVRFVQAAPILGAYLHRVEHQPAKQSLTAPAICSNAPLHTHPPLLPTLLPNPPQRRHPLLHVPRHPPQHLVRRAMRMRRSPTDVAQPAQRHNLGQILLRHALHGRELLPQRLPLDEVLVHGARAVERDLEPLCRCWFRRWGGEGHGWWG